jgi:hypothetical protein
VEYLYYTGKDGRILNPSDYNTTTTDNCGIWNEWDSKVKWRLINGTSGLPKGSNSYGNGQFILLDYSMKFGRYPSLMLRKQEGIRFHSSSTESHLGFPGLLKLEELRKQSLNQVKLDNIYDLMLDYDLHVAAYEKVRKNKGSNTPGVDGITLDGISISSIRETIKRLKDHTFKFKPSRREYIPKANGKLRPLGISSPIDKVVQQVMVFILEVI